MARPAVSVFAVPKAERQGQPSDDRYAVCGLPRETRLALSDGATTTSEAGLWAELLARAGAEWRWPWALDPRLHQRIQALRGIWGQEGWKRLPQPPPWFRIEGLERGAWATLLMVKIKEDTWWAQAVGDTCLLHLRGGQLIQSFPYTSSEEFQAAPCMVGSLPREGEALGTLPLRAKGKCRRGDLLLLATDALAKRWLQPEIEAPPLEDWLEGGDPMAFEDWVARERAAHRLDDDDTTLMVYPCP
ncbi:hypothetical protein [Holophaga foetida]|uniref:hypothetical protein n=1 Tax=Holophaga foetida TaxID=35839 RepID=UPI0002471C23|nr:hypothetical protein [Holophaga foetida]